MVDLKSVLPQRKPDAHKGDFGTALMFCGSRLMPGAAIIATGAALRCGVGLAVLASCQNVINIAATVLPEAVYFDTDTDRRTLAQKIESADAILFGPGMGQSENAVFLLSHVLEYGKCPLVIDADGINLVSRGIQLNRYSGRIVLTPHAGEAGRLLCTGANEVQANRQTAVLECAQKYGVATVLKGNGTLIAFEDGSVHKNTTGNPGMAKPGSGDMLAGMMTSFLAQGIPFCDAVTAAVQIHGMAGDLCAEKMSQRAMLVTDMINCLPDIFKTLE